MINNDKYSVNYWVDLAQSNSDDSKWFSACAQMAQALATERQAAALARIAAVMEAQEARRQKNDADIAKGVPPINVWTESEKIWGSEP